MHEILLDVVIINWNGMHFLSECLDGLRKQTYRTFSVVFVDNGSHDGSIDFVKHYYPEVEIVALSENFGFAVANNIALKRGKRKYVALLNNDAVPRPSWIESLLDAIEYHPEAGCAASKILYYDNPDILDRAGDVYTRAGAGFLRGRGQPEYNFDNEEWIFGACAGAALYRTSMLNDIGFFDEDFFLLYEDVDLSFRAQLKGYKCLYVPEAIVYHKASSSIVYDSPISVYYSHRNLEWVYLKNVPFKLILKTIWLHVVYDIAAFAFFSLQGKMKPFLRAKWDALRGTKNMLRKRRLIQKTRTVDDDYIWSLLEKERLFPRLSRRLRKG